MWGMNGQRSRAQPWQCENHRWNLYPSWHTSHCTDAGSVSFALTFPWLAFSFTADWQLTCQVCLWPCLTWGWPTCQHEWKEAIEVTSTQLSLRCHFTVVLIYFFSGCPINPIETIGLHFWCGSLPGFKTWQPLGRRHDAECKLSESAPINGSLCHPCHF